MGAGLALLLLLLLLLGADAYQLAPWLTALRVSTGGTLNGAAGVLYSDAEGRIRRQLLWATFENGQTVKILDNGDPRMETDPTTSDDNDDGAGSIQ